MLHGILKFPDVAWPRVGFKNTTHVGIDRRWILAFPRLMLKDMVNKGQDVFGPLSQRLNLDGNDAETVVEVLAELAFLEQGLQSDVSWPPARARRWECSRCCQLVALPSPEGL